LKWSNKEKTFLKFGLTNYSKSFFAEKDHLNLTYILSGYDFKYKNNVLTISKPNPNDLDNSKDYSGKIFLNDEKNQFDLVHGLSDASLRLLKDNHFSVLSYTFEKEMEPMEKRWVRLKFEPEMAAIYHPPFMKLISQWLLNTIYFNYQILGPFDVLAIFKERLLTQRFLADRTIKELKRNEKENEEKINSLELIKSCADEIENITLSQIDKDSVTIKDLNMHIFPGRLRNLSSIYSMGNIEPNGTMPNYLPPDNILKYTTWQRRVYDWSLKSEVLKSDEGFSIFFTGYFQNRIIRSFLLIVIIWLITIDWLYPLSKKFSSNPIFLTFIKSFIGFIWSMFGIIALREILKPRIRYSFSIAKEWFRKKMHGINF
jgi:hypothetical protein